MRETHFVLAYKARAAAHTGEVAVMGKSELSA